MSYLFSYVILHYGAYEETVKAIESIERTDRNNKSRIVVVDNGSSDQSGKRLQDKYKDTETVHILLNKRNEGFARGNNIGYRFARNKLHADFIVIMNNDVEILQKDFEQRVCRSYADSSFHVLGPDIVTPGGEHRNPHREHTFNRRDLNRIIWNRTIILKYLRLKHMLGWEEKIRLIEDWEGKRILKERKSTEAYRKHRCAGTVLQGSFLVFSPQYIKRENLAFYPGTFMYMEEEILAYLCREKKYLCIYDPRLKVFHKEEAATGNAMGRFDQYLFYTQNLRDSARIMKKVISG